MTDEKYVYVQDVREKKRNARGAFHKRTHAGKGGAVKFPSDFLSRKELKAMNGETKSYRLNDPMTWEEFKGMPEDIKIMYIKGIREKFGVADTKIFEMMGVHQATGSREIKRLGIGVGRNAQHKSQDIDGWIKWKNGIHDFVRADQGLCVAHDVLEGIVPMETGSSLPGEELEKYISTPAVPSFGSLTFEGNADEMLKTIGMILQGSYVHLSVQWEFAEKPGERVSE